MKKLFKVLLCVFILVCAGCSKTEEVEVEPDTTVYSKDIKVISKDFNSVEELSGKTIAVQETFDKEYSDFAIEKLKEEGAEISENNLHWFTSYADIKFLIDEGSIDAWVIYDNREDTIMDYRSDYVPSDYKVLATYNMPLVEEGADTSGLVDYLYNKPFMVMCHGLDGYGDNSIHEWNIYRNDVNHLLVCDPVNKHVLLISVPRDSYIVNQATTYQDKFTHFCQNGPDNPANSLGVLLDVEIPYYCFTSFTSFVEGINNLGGVKVNVPMDAHLDMDSTRNVANPVSVKKGESNLWGEWALALSRNRKYDGIVHNDQGRIRNQALIIDGLIEKIANHPYLLKMVGMSWLWDYLCENNLSQEEKNTLIELAQTFADGYTIDNYFILGEEAMINERYYIIPNEDSVEIAKGKIELVTTGKVSKDNPYYDEIMKGYITGGTGTENDGVDGFIGTYYDLNEVFGEE